MSESLSDEQSLKLCLYQALANETNVIDDRPVTLLLLGLFGEIGSLVSELKKKQRDEKAHIGFRTSVIEELGDVLWYVASLSTRFNLSLESLARIAFRDRVPQEGILTFSSVQQAAMNRVPTSAQLEGTLIKLSSDGGTLLTEFLKNPAIARREMSLALAAVFGSLIEAAIQADVRLAVAADKNLKKTFSRWPAKRDYPALFDEGLEEEEQLPRLLEIRIAEKNVGGSTYVYQQCRGINIGDRITDNKAEEDDYRFHDVFHLAYAAVLGWSPVTRALFKVKRKSNPQIDENEDGARAIITEEAISALVFHHAQQLNYYENLTSLDYGLLKAVRSLSVGYEVQKCPLWVWEEAILQGYTVFRELRQHRRGLVRADLASRKIEFRKITNDTH